MGMEGEESFPKEKEVLLKVVALSIPTFTMSYFKLPDSLCDEVNKMMARFLWSQKEDERKIYYFNGDNLCAPKCFGGLGFEALKIFKYTLLAKQGWRLLQNKDSLLFKIYCAQYFPQGDFFETHLGTNLSYA